MKPPLTPLLIMVLILLVPGAVSGGITENGGTGILEVDTPETLHGGRLGLSLSPRYGYLDASQSRLHTFVGNAALTLGLSGELEIAASIPLQALFRTDTDAGAGAIFDEDFTFRVRDLEWKVRKALRLGGERLRFGLQAVGTAPIGSNRKESVYAPGDSLQVFTADEWNYGAMLLTTLDLTGASGNAPVRLHANVGYYYNKNEDDYRYRLAFRYPLPLPAPEEDKQNDLLLLAAGIEFPVGRLSAFGELTTEQLVNQRGLVRFEENPINMSGGLRFLFPGGVGLSTALTLNLSGNDDRTAFDPSKLYPDWEARVALSFGDVLQSRRQRLARKREAEAREAARVEAREAARADSQDTTSVQRTEEKPPVEPPASAAALEDSLAGSGMEESAVAKEPVQVLSGNEVPATNQVEAGPPPSPDSTPEPESPPADEPVPAAAGERGMPDALAPAASGTAVPPGEEPVSSAPDPMDRDGDGILDQDDRCPGRAEDWDGFRDLDGCPDLDNDGDGILDLNDNCPNSPEDFLLPNPMDGCPSPFLRLDAREGSIPPEGKTEGPRTSTGIRAEAGETSGARAPGLSSLTASDLADTDGDGVPDVRDKCPLQAEDPDGWEDQDGCPDRDNDGDGFLDGNDDCPNAPETWNGYEDGDGCPDARPDPVKEPHHNQVATIDTTPLDVQLEKQAQLTRDLSDLLVTVQGSRVVERGEKLNPQADWDDDGVGDLYDRCPEIPEDVDGWEDQDGCPDLDNDGDGIFDKDDGCPNAPETLNGYEDADGCPDQVPVPVVVPMVEPKPAAPAEIEKPEPEAVPVVPQAPAAPQLEEIVFFPSGGSSLDASARKILDELAMKLKSLGDDSVRLVGFSDSRGDAEANLELSRQRARRVREHLVLAGVPADRLTVSARGEVDPLGDNDSSEGRARNRRVEIIRVPGAGGGER